MQPKKQLKVQYIGIFEEIDIIVSAARRFGMLLLTAWNRYYSIVLSRVSRHSICNEHTHPNGLTGQTLG